MEIELNEELYFEGTFNKEGLLRDLQYRFEEENNFLDHMEYKQQNAIIHSIIDNKKRDNFVFPEKERPKKSEDYVC